MAAKPSRRGGARPGSGPRTGLSEPLPHYRATRLSERQEQAILRICQARRLRPAAVLRLAVDALIEQEKGREMNGRR